MTRSKKPKATVVNVADAFQGMGELKSLGGSMSDTYDRGSILYSKAVPVSSLRVGDVITYLPPRGEGPGGLVTHRIAAIRRHRGGIQTIRTKGDANEHADPWTFKLEQPVQARASFGIPYVGYALAALSIKPVRMLVIGLPALLIALLLLTRMWRDAGEELRRREAATRTGATAS